MTFNLDKVMHQFARFLDASWHTVSAVAETMERVDTTEFVSDWAQANWEILVETPFREIAGFSHYYLEAYGDGADCNDVSSRVWNPAAMPTHCVVCYAMEGASMLDLLTSHLLDTAETPVEFDHFAVKSEGGWHEHASPFDCVLGYQGEREVLIRLEQVSFVAEPLREL